MRILSAFIRQVHSFNLGGIKANRMGTWALSRLSTVSAGRVQPVLDMDFVLKNLELYEKSIDKRGIFPKPDIRKLPELYAEALALREARDKAQRNREENSAEVHLDRFLPDLQLKASFHGCVELLFGKVAKVIRERKIENEKPSREVEELKEKGKVLRDELRAAVINFNRVNDQIIDLVISLPNLLDPETPMDMTKVLRSVPVPAGVKQWTTPPDLEWTVIPGNGLNWKLLSSLFITLIIY